MSLSVVTAALTFGFRGVQSSLHCLESATGQEGTWTLANALQNTREPLLPKKH